MRHLIMLAAASAITLMGVSASQAQPQPRTTTDCPRGQQTCVKPDDARAPGQRANEANRRPTPQATPPRPDSRTAQQAAPRRDNRPMPKAGASARGGQPFQRAAGSRISAPPRGQEYRVVNEHLVLVDSRSQNIVTVLGLLSNLTR